MDFAFEEKIRLRAYQVWQAAGMSEGEAERHWLHAERAVHEEAAVFAEEAAPTKSVRKPASKTVFAKANGTKANNSPLARTKAKAIKSKPAETKTARTVAPRRSKIAVAAEAVA